MITLWIVTWSYLTHGAASQALVSMTTSEYVAEEGSQFEVVLSKSGTAASSINVVVQVDSPYQHGGLDFIGTSQTTIFPPGTDAETSTVIFTVLDDTIPEPDETFLLVLRVTNGDGVTSDLSNQGTVTIAANDDGFGIFGFASPQTTLHTDELSVDSAITLTVHRARGTYSTVHVTYQVLSNVTSDPGDLDLGPETGSVTFYEGETEKQLSVTVYADQTPEPDELFVVQLTEASGGHSVLPRSNQPRVNASLSRARVVVRGNDAPLSFSRSEYRVDEGAFESTLRINLVRGLKPDEVTLIGPISQPASIGYFLQPITAIPGVDFVGVNGSVGFSPGVTQGVLNIQILPDDLPEVAERFQIILENPTGDVVIGEPSICTVIINANDDFNGVLSLKTSNDEQFPKVIVNEDTTTVADFTVVRGGGSFGIVSVDWLLVYNNTASSGGGGDVIPTMGRVELAEGETEKNISLEIIQDNVPEPTERYFLRLLPGSVAGGASVEGVLQGELIVQDSDEAHGVVEYTAGDVQRLVTTTSPRKLVLSLVRTGGILGSLEIKFKVIYRSQGQEVTDLLLSANPGSFLFPAGESSYSFEIWIKDEAFLEVDAKFDVTLTDIGLSDPHEVGPYNTPRLGSAVVTEIPVTMESANGEVGFGSVEVLTVMEPDGITQLTTQVQLPVTRVGTNGEVYVSWSLAGGGPNPDHLTEDDVTPRNGTLRMGAGQTTAVLSLSVLPDDLPETAETFTVTLTTLDPAATQRLRPGAESVTVTIAENDDAGGVFSFSEEMDEVYTLQEEVGALAVVIVRRGGALVRREVEYTISPGGDAEFYGGTNVVRFSPGDVRKTVTVLAKGDGIPELMEQFELRLHSFGDTEAVIGERNTIQIIVKANEHPYGILQFPSDNFTVFVNESKGADVHYALLPVQRTLGRFGIASIDWSLFDAETNTDMSPVRGILTFEPGVGEVNIQMEILSDEIPEDAEEYFVNITNPTGDAVLGDFLTARVVIVKNDDPIYFQVPTTLEVSEPSTTNLTVLRGGSLTGPASVRYRTVDGSATEAGRDYVIVTVATLVWAPGVVAMEIPVTVLEDDTAEPDETFYVELYDARGDVAVFGPQAEIVIMSNDQSNGIFRFSPPYHLSVGEGEVATFELSRDSGIYGDAHIHYQIYHNNTDTLVAPGDDFSANHGVVKFGDRDQRASLYVTPLRDGVPEHDEVYNIRLYNVTGGRPSDPGTLATFDLEVVVTVTQNDDPNGVFLFADVTREVAIAEDAFEGDENTTVATLTVERQQGLFGAVQVLWEAFSYQIAGAGNLPILTDLLFLGAASPNVTEMSDLRRPGTGTRVLSFTGCTDCYVTVPPAHHTPRSDIQNGFSVSAWIQPGGNMDGYLVAKTTADSARVYYAVRLTTERTGDHYSTTVTFQYSYREQAVLSESTSLSLDLADGRWHFLLLCVDNGQVFFYLDGVTRGTRSLEAESSQDGPGMLLVGAVAPGDHHYVGLMQDVRVYSRKLDINEIRELYETPSTTDITPVSGYVTFPAGSQSERVVIRAHDDTEEEANDVFSVKIISASGGGRVSENDATATLTVLKSDNANGLFGFAGACVALLSDREDTLFTCPVSRRRGDTDTVTLRWEITPVITPDGLERVDPAEADFVNASGELVFEPGERQKLLTFRGHDDDLPELQETFDLSLTHAYSADGLTGSTNHSGASVDPATRVNTVTLAESDYPYGLLQFSLVDSPPLSAGVQPATEQPKLTIPEEVSMVTLVVVRARGTLGRVGLEWRTVDGTARSAGKTPPDYVAEVSSLTFDPNQLYTLINVTILDNDLPESDKYFFVELINPTGGAAVGVGSKVKVVIQHSDQAYGVFMFDEPSRKVVAMETGDSGSEPIELKILREGGSIGPATVTWEVLSDLDNDLIMTSGVATFVAGQTQAEVTVQIRGDTVPELDEMFVIKLVNVTQGSLGDNDTITSTLTVLANDDPYGVFVIMPSFRPIRVEEGTVVPITITRRPTSGYHGAVIVSYRTLAPSELYPHLPGGATRADRYDYGNVSGDVMMAAGAGRAEFNVTVEQDAEAEVEEAVFVELTGVELSDGGTQITAPPRLGPPTETYAQILISQNDHPNGILELSTSEVEIDEDHRGPLVEVVRTAGAFGAVTVKFEVVPLSAIYGLDYSVSSSDVLLLAGERHKRLPVTIVDDGIPEPAETFTVRLLGVQLAGGATLGNVTECNVTIRTSDDLHGAFGFESVSLSTEESPSDSTVDIPVVRLGGAQGLVAIGWEATNNGSGAGSDISPASGTVYFVSNEARQMIRVAVLADDEPEGLENITFRLVSVNNAARLDPARSSFTLRVLPNDNPHGTVEFGRHTFYVSEGDDDGAQYVSVTRRGGSYGALRVHFHTAELSLTHEATRDGSSLESYFLQEAQGVGPQNPGVGTGWDIGNQPNPLQACLSFCLLSEACLAVYYSAVRVQCTWYSVPYNTFLDNRTGFVFYQKDTARTDPLYASQAKPALDFRVIPPSASVAVTIPDGATSGSLPVIVYPDDIPELDERFTITVSKVELLGDLPANPQNLPRLGDLTTATVTIATNDDANGVFRVYSSDPRAEDRGQTVAVDERDRLAVELVVQRQGGTIGRVSVTWYIVDERTTASRDHDYVADGATLTFLPGQTRRTLTIAIEDDSLPEDDEMIVIGLKDSQGGAVIGPHDHATVKVKANDHVAGLLSFKDTALVVEEGDLLTLTLLRSAPALGIVLVSWQVVTKDNGSPGNRFRTDRGQLYFREGEREKQILLHVQVDNRPKINQEYRVVLHNIVTTGVRESGAAEADPASGEAHITIQGGGDPHGVFSFPPGVLRAPARVSEGGPRYNLTVERKFGAIGLVRVYYDVRVGSRQILTPTLSLATPNADFSPVTMATLVFPDGVSSATVTMAITDDAEPEVEEVFVVELVSVELVEPRSSTFRPRIDLQGALAEIIINANDGTQGEVKFADVSQMVHVNETLTNVSLVIQRSKGTFGRVSVYCYAQNTVSDRGVTGAILGEDFTFTPLDLMFEPGETDKVVTVTIFQDNYPEPAESLEVILDSPKGGLVLGQPRKAMITISANDMASGVINFESQTNITLNEPSTPGAEGSQASLTIVRGPGIYGVVTVQYRVVMATAQSGNGGDAVTDISPASGVVTLQDRQATVTLDLSAVPDALPEEAEMFYVYLSQPEGGATLGPNVRKTVIVERNDAPYGLIQIYPTGHRNQTVEVEESAGELQFDVERSLGSLGRVSVVMTTVAGSARAAVGNNVTFSLTQQIPDQLVSSWYSFEAYGLPYLVMLSRQWLGSLTSAVGSPGTAPADRLGSLTPSRLYRWQGALVSVQSIETDGASSAEAFDIDGATYLFIANHGQFGRHSTKSRLYTVNKDGSLTVLQEFATRGATDAAHFTYADEHYLLVTNHQDNRGNTDIRSDLYRWEPANQRMGSLPVKYLDTVGARAVDVMYMDGVVYIVVASYMDSKSRNYEMRSLIYKFDVSRELVVHQQIPTEGATDIKSFHTATDTYLVIANQQNNFGDTDRPVQVYSWNSLTEKFGLIQELPSDNVQVLHVFLMPDNSKYHLMVVERGSSSRLYSWEDSVGQFVPMWAGSTYLDLYPLRVPQPQGSEVMVLEAPDVQEMGTVNVHQLALLGLYDYFPRSVTVTFEPGQTRVQLSVSVTDDDVPEDTESFRVRLTNPRHGAELGAHSQVTVAILSNDNGHGVIEFADDSLSRLAEETPDRDNDVSLNIVRRRGNSGRVVVAWRASGDHQGVYDINPVHGQVELADGQSAATVTVTVRDDGIAEVDEVTVVTLTEVLQSGSSLPGRGAVIGPSHECRLTVLANDSPYGVVHWAETNATVQEPEEDDSTGVRLTVTRSQGNAGHIRVHYITEPSVDHPPSQRAISGVDYVSAQGSVDMLPGVTTATLDIVVLADSVPELAEYFTVVITDAQLIAPRPQGAGVSGVSGPSIHRPRGLVTVRVEENDNARGSVHFNVTRNLLGRIDVYEGIGSVRLPIVRSVGHFGVVEVTWQATPREADTGDFSPAGGAIRFEEEQTETFIEIFIQDDSFPENLQTFDVSLVSVTSGGAALGTDRSVRVAIEKNDSPSGVISFTPLQKSVREARTPDDPEGAVTFDLQRSGTEGEVTVEWRLSPDAVDDFELPHAGTVTFMTGESRKSVTLRTMPDDLLEGREEFTLSIVSATNNADISPRGGDVTVVILADRGAAGEVYVHPAYRTVYIGEPARGYTGTADIMLSRRSGRYGEVKVTWQLVRRDLMTFTQVTGEVTFRDQQKNATITIQAVDDSLPETQDQYTLQLTAATGGATVDPSASAAVVVMAASDHPHGLLECGGPTETRAQEGGQVTIAIERHYGINGQVRVYYTTSDGSTHSDITGSPDYEASADWLVFNEGETRKTVNIRIFDDDLAEGPETFYLNLTEVQLLSPITNNYTIINGLSLDMAPEIGPQSVKTIVIVKNDLAEGVVEFDVTAMGVIAHEDAGEVRLPLVRGPGVFGSVSATYSLSDVTATHGQDYTATRGRATFSDGEGRSVVTVTIENDALREFEETFRVTLEEVEGGATLGRRRQVTVTIAKSDYPNGKFGFQGTTDVVIPNPDIAVDVPVSVERTEGLLGTQTLLWRIMGPNNPNHVLDQTMDIGYQDPNFPMETTQGQLTWEANEAGAKTFVLRVKPHVGWEIQKSYLLMIYDVQGFPADQGSGQVSPTAGNLTFTIAKFGFPNGIVGFDGLAQVPRRVDEPLGGSTEVSFSLVRREGTMGTIQIHWAAAQVPQRPSTNVTDFSPASGVVTMAPGVVTTEIILGVVADNVPEIDEDFVIVLTRIEGGADIDRQYNSSKITVGYNDAPHGRFSVQSSLQAVVVNPETLKRQLRLNFTRHAGAFGRVRLNFGLEYDQADPGLSYAPSSGSVVFNSSETFTLAHVHLESRRFLGLNTTFTVTLGNVELMDTAVTEPPEIIPEESVAKVMVPMEAANTRIGFLDSVVSVNEESSVAVVTLTRHGAYGGLTVGWVSGFPGDGRPADYERGVISPLAGDLAMRNGLQQTDFTVQVLPKPSVPELFALHLPSPPITAAPGGAQTWPGHTLCRIEPHGVVGFTAGSREVTVTESDTEGVELTLYVERVYGSQDAVQIRYRTDAGTATADSDYRHITSGAVTMDAGQTRAAIFVQILPDADPETDEHFHVNLTSVTRLPTDAEHDLSPRLSTVAPVATVTIRSSNDPLGVFSLTVDGGEYIGKAEPSRVTLTISRTGGVFGSVTVRVRTVGGGEPWDAAISPSTGGLVADTIAQALGGRDEARRALVGQDYERLDTEVVFEPGVNQKKVSVLIMDDAQSEDEETLFVYLDLQMEGARVARPSTDNGKKGFVQMNIRRNDFWNGFLGFSLINSTRVDIDEDSGKPVTLTVERQNASYGNLRVNWRAIAEPGVALPQSARINLADQLEATTGSVQCAASAKYCSFDVQLKQDQIPENATWFLVDLYLSGSPSQEGATIDENRRYANITVVPSDNPNGLIQWAQTSRLVYISLTTSSVELRVERAGYTSKPVTVRYRTRQLAGTTRSVAGVSVYSARQGADYDGQQGLINFSPGQVDSTVTLTLDPQKASDVSYPKTFDVILEGATSLAQLGESVSSVTIADLADVMVWDLWPLAQRQLNNNSIIRLMSEVERTVANDLTEPQLSIVKATLEAAIEAAETHPLQLSASAAVLSAFCRLLAPGRTDAVRGHWQLAGIMERFVYSLLTGRGCTDDFIQSSSCVHARYAVANMYPEEINTYKYTSKSQDYFAMPSNLLRVADHGRQSTHPKCYPVAFIEYSSDVWFPQTEKLLNNKVLSASVKDGKHDLSEPVRFRINAAGNTKPSANSKCVYLDESRQQWSPSVCLVDNNRTLGVDGYVTCACVHLSVYAVSEGVPEPVQETPAYPMYFYIACSITIACMALAVLSHHACHLTTMFTADLIMHMCFSVLATEVCYVIAAALSPRHLLAIAPDDDNYRCIVMALFTHYFYLTQFTWMMTQSINLFKILVLNDENTTRKYITYFFVGWGLPLLLVAIFYAVTYVIYQYLFTHIDPKYIYGDVLGTKDICFITNAYAGLAGVVAPSLICLMVVGVVFIQAFQITPQWQYYDDIYRGRYNRNEVRFLLVFFGLLVLTWLWGGLHLAYGQPWMLIIFCIFNIAMGVYVLVLYMIVRIPCLNCFKPQKAVVSDSNNTMTTATVTTSPGLDSRRYDTRVHYDTRTNSMVAESLKGSRQVVLHPEEQPWEKETIVAPPHQPVMSTNSLLRVKRAPATAAMTTSPSHHSNNIYILPPGSGHRGPPAVRLDDDDSQNLDDLILALRTGAVPVTTTPSDASYPGDTTGITTATDSSVHGGLYERRRPGIADTHL